MNEREHLETSLKTVIDHVQKGGEAVAYIRQLDNKNEMKVIGLNVYANDVPAIIDFHVASLRAFYGELIKIQGNKDVKRVAPLLLKALKEIDK